MSERGTTMPEQLLLFDLLALHRDRRASASRPPDDLPDLDLDAAERKLEAERRELEARRAEAARRAKPCECPKPMIDTAEGRCVKCGKDRAA